MLLHQATTLTLHKLSFLLALVALIEGLTPKNLTMKLTMRLALILSIDYHKLG